MLQIVSKMKKGNVTPIIVLLHLIAVLFLILVFLNFPESNTQKFKIVGYSMYPSLTAGGKIKVDYDYYIDNNILRGDVVAIKFKTRDEVLLKRVVALAGDKFEIKDDLIYLNDKILLEPYLGDVQIDAEKALILKAQLDAYNGYVPMNSFIVLGDNRAASFDSADFGIIDRKQIVGKVIA